MVPDPDEAVGRISGAEKAEREVSVLREQNITVEKGKDRRDRVQGFALRLMEKEK